MMAMPWLEVALSPPLSEGMRMAESIEIGSDYGVFLVADFGDVPISHER